MAASLGRTDGDNEERDGEGADGGAVSLGSGLQEGEGAEPGAGADEMLRQSRPLSLPSGGGKKRHNTHGADLVPRGVPRPDMMRDQSSKAYRAGRRRPGRTSRRWRGA